MPGSASSPHGWMREHWSFTQRFCEILQNIIPRLGVQGIPQHRSRKVAKRTIWLGILGTQLSEKKYHCFLISFFLFESFIQN